MSDPQRMPAVFVGHGNPMNAIETNRYTEAWRAFGASIPKPKAVLAVSAHWYINATAALATPIPRTIHDFYGFPKALYDVEYPAQGDPELVAVLKDLAKPTWVGLDRDSWGLDHGTWSVLVHVFPEADVPVIQLSIDATKPPSYYLELGRRRAVTDGARDGPPKRVVPPRGPVHGAHRSVWPAMAPTQVGQSVARSVPVGEPLTCTGRGQPPKPVRDGGSPRNSSPLAPSATNPSTQL